MYVIPFDHPFSRHIQMFGPRTGLAHFPVSTKVTWADISSDRPTGLVEVSAYEFIGSNMFVTVEPVSDISDADDQVHIVTHDGLRLGVFRSFDRALGFASKPDGTPWFHDGESAIFHPIKSDLGITTVTVW
jgi:hypothetical protein